MHNFAEKKGTHPFPEHYVPCLSSIEKQTTKWQREGQQFHRAFNNSYLYLFKFNAPLHPANSNSL